MQIRTLMTVLLAASLGALVTGCERSDTGSAQPQSRIDSPMRQGTAPGAATQGREDWAGKASSSTAVAPTQPPESSAMAPQADEQAKPDEAAKQKGSS